MEINDGWLRLTPSRKELCPRSTSRRAEIRRVALYPWRPLCYGRQTKTCAIFAISVRLSLTVGCSPDCKNESRLTPTNKKKHSALCLSAIGIQTSAWSDDNAKLVEAVNHAGGFRNAVSGRTPLIALHLLHS